MTTKRAPAVAGRILLQDICRLIEEVRSAVATMVNTGLTILYWRMGQRIHDEILKCEPAGYGEEMVATRSRPLIQDYGGGCTRTTL
ncbi:MAG: DUF1016 N-terminal domain-containing protein [Acidobacteriaceae bacterium]